MRWTLIALLMLPGLAHASLGRVSVGLGYEAKVDRDINPDNSQVNSMGEFFATIGFRPWSILLEIDQYQTRSADGVYAIQATSYTPMTWGRFEPWSYLTVSPFAGLGLGWNFQDVSTSFGTAHDERWADGGMVGGLALGAKSDFWKHWRVEGEMRLLKEEFTEQPVASFVLRSGYTF